MKRLLLGMTAAMMAPAISASPNLSSSIYVAAEITHTDFDFSKSDFPAFSVGGTTFVPTDVESRDTGTQFLIGIRPHRNISVDVGHVDFGQASVTYQPYNIEEEASADGLAVGVNALFPMQHQVTLFARAGVLDWDLENELSIVGTTVASIDDDGSDPFIGVGLLFGWDALKFRGSFTRYEVADEDLDTFSAGVQYFFAL